MTPSATPPSVPPSGCVVAIRADVCCPTLFPAPAQQVAQDPCLAPYPATLPFPKACKAKLGKSCESVKCGLTPLISRLARPLQGGTCTWKSECNTAADCRLADNVAACCYCTAPWPLELVQRDPCIHDHLLNTPPPKHCSAHCAGLDCGACPPPPSSVCVPSGTPGINVCQAASP